MFRRSRFSIRPNVGTTGRTAAAPQEAPAVNKDADDTPKDVSVGNTATSESDNKSVVAQLEKPTTQGDGNDQNGEGTSTSAAVQRRKRFTVKPKVAPGRPSVAARTQRSPVKAAFETPIPDSEHAKPTPTSHTPTTEISKGPLSPRNRRLSEESKQAKTQPKPSLIPSDCSEPSVVAPAEDLLNKSPEGSGKNIESTTGGQMKEVHFKVPDKVLSSLPDKEAVTISERAKALVSSKTGLSPSPAAYTLSRLLNDPSDLQRLAKAQKLRELLKKEIHKEKRKRKASIRPKEFTLDPAKMTMRDLIHYLPESNPMTTSLEDPANPENETIVPPSPEREDSPERAQEPEAPPKAASPRVEDEDEEEAAEEEQEEALLVPQVKVAEDGSLIIDEESLTVEVQRAKGPNPADDRDPIFERGSTTTYSSFRKGTYSKPWSSEETDMFFLAISMVGTDFSMICQLFPHRSRSEIKNKFKKEERANAWRIDKAFRERRKLDIEYFSKLLEKILEVQKTRKKLKSLGEKNSSRKNKRKTKGKKAAKKLDDIEEEEGEDIPDLEGEEEGEKENEDLCNEGGTPTPKPKRKRKRKNEQSASPIEPHDKKNKTDKKSSKQHEACIPEDAEAALPNDHADSELSEKAENVKACKDTAIKPAKLSRGRAPKPLLQLGRKRGKKPPTSPEKTKDAASDNGEKSVNEGATEEQTNEDASPKRQDNERRPGSDGSSEDEDVTDVHPPKPTRYGRTPKPTKPLNYPARDNSLSSSETTPTSQAGSATSTSKHKPKCTAKKRKPSKPPSAQESKKPKLFTLRASQSEYSDDEENENQWEEEQQPECSSNRDNSAFVPASLRSPRPVIVDVEETVEELDILVNMPDVLGISQDALCPDATCKLAQNETGLAEPCEHQLDLLVDVIDCLSSDYTVAEDESYNEAAHTLLTIGNLTHLSQVAENQTVTHDHAKAAGTTSVSGENIASKPAAQDEISDTPVLPVTLDQGATEMSESAATVGPRERSKDDGEDVSAASPQQSEKLSPQTRKGRSIKVKPKPNLGKASRSKKADCGQTHQEEASTSQENSVDQITSGATTTDQNTSETDCSAGVGIEEQATTESTDKILKSEISNTNDSSDNLVTSDMVVSTNTDSCPIQQSSDHPAPSVTPVEDLPASQREVSEGVSSSQTKKSGSHRVKPKPNLSKTARSAHSKPPITKDTEEKACSPTPDPQSHERPIEDTAAESTCTTSSEKSQSTISAPELKQSVDVESLLTPTAGPSTPVEKEAAVALVESSVAASDGRTTENRSVPETSPESSQTSESTEDTVTHIQATETSLGPGLDTDSALVKDTGDHCASGKTPVGELHACQKDDSPRPAGKSRFQKIKPKPNIALASRTVRPTLRTTGETFEKSSHPTPNPDVHDKMTGDHEAEPAGNTSSENTSCAPNVIPSFDAAAALTTTEDLSTAEEKKLDVGVLGQVESSTATPDQLAIQEKAAPGSSTDERVEGLPVSPEKDSKVTLTCQTGESEKVEPEPHLTARSALSKSPTPEGPVTNQNSVEEPASATQNLVSDKAFAEIETQPTCSTTSLEGQGQIEPSGTASLSELSLGSCLTQKPEELSSTGEQETDAESEQVSTAESTGRNVPPRRGRFSRVKPNLVSCTRKRSTRPQPDVSRKGLESRQADTSSDETSEKQSKSNRDVQVQLTEKDSEHLTSGNGSLQAEAVSSTQLEPAQSQPDIQSSEDASAESEVKPADAQSMSDTKESAQQLCAETVPEVKSQDVIPQSSENKPPASQSEHNNESEPLKSSETSRKAPQASRGRLVKPKPNLGHCRRAQQQKAAQPKPDAATPSEGVDVPTSGATSEGHTDTQEPAEGATEQHINKDSSEVVEQLSQLDFTQNVAGSSLSCLPQVDPSSQLQEGSTFGTGENQSQPNLTIFSDMLPEPVPSDPDEPFFILSLTEIPLAEVVGGASEPLPCLADASKQELNVPGDVLGGASDGSHTDVAVPVSTEDVSDTYLINVKETEQDPAAYVGAVTENPVDPQASASVQPLILLETAAENEVTECRAENKRQRSTQRRAAKLQTKPKTSIEKPDSEKTESTPTTLSEPFASSVEPESSEQTATKSREESGDDADIVKDAVTGWREPEDSGSKAKVKRASSRRKQKRSTSSPETKSTSPSSDAPPCKTAPKGPEAKTPRSVGQRSSTAPVASTSYDVTPTPAETEPSGETVPTPPTVSPTQEHTQGRVSPNPACSTPCTAELLDFQQSDIQQSSSKAEEEEQPTNVSQYFLSDIFTEVEDE